MLSLAHLSDVHLPLGRVRVAELFNKRFIGLLSWRLKRYKVHLPAISDALMKDIRTLNPDHAAFTGDLINIAAASEFSTATDWLHRAGPPDWLTMVPGNHDAYVDVPSNQGLSRWAAYMQGDFKLPGGTQPQPFPFVRQRRNVALIGLSSAIPETITRASGRLGAVQLEMLSAILHDLHTRGYFRVVLLHHPPLAGQAKPRKALRDAEQLRSVLELNGAELILHGHNHTHMQAQLETRTGTAHIFGVPSASALAYHGKPAAAWNLYQINRTRGGWRCDVLIRSYDAAQGTFDDHSSTQLDF